MRNTMTQETCETARCQRLGCRGILRSPESIARGMSAACDRKVRQAEAAAAERGTFNAEQQAKADAAIRSGEVKVEAPGLYSVPSSRGDGSRYASDGISCCCPAGAHDRQCWHLLAATTADILLTPRNSLMKVA
jgi:hypothetical protein